MGDELSSLPSELLLDVAINLGPVDLLSLALVCPSCSRVAQDPRLWQALVAQRMQPMIQTFFDDVAPQPQPSHTWKQHFFEFDRSWKMQAQQRSNRLLVQVGEQQLSGRDRHETVPLYCLWSEIWAPAPRWYGVYDLTDFSDSHPGSDLIISDAAAAADATNWFEMAAHSDTALRVLKTMAVPGMEALPYDTELRSLRQSWRQPSICRSIWTQSCAVLTGMLACYHAYDALVIGRNEPSNNQFLLWPTIFAILALFTMLAKSRVNSIEKQVPLQCCK